MGGVKRILNLIATNDLSRVNTIIKIFLKQKAGTQSIIQKLQLEISGLYKCKSYSQHEVDIGILVLRIGGPRLIYSLYFSKNT